MQDIIYVRRIDLSCVAFNKMDYVQTSSEVFIVLWSSILFTLLYHSFPLSSCPGAEFSSNSSFWRSVGIYSLSNRDSDVLFRQSDLSVPRVLNFICWMFCHCRGLHLASLMLEHKHSLNVGFSMCSAYSSLQELGSWFVPEQEKFVWVSNTCLEWAVGLNPAREGGGFFTNK